MEIRMICAVVDLVGIRFQQKGLIIPSLYELGNSFHSFNINKVEVDSVKIRLE
jgi:hypothetical protein